jgi:type II secretory pathway component PulJ
MTDQGGSRRGEGFTVIELCISIALLGILMLVMTGAMFTAFKVNRQTQDRLGASYDIQRATTFFAQDVYGAEQVILGGAALCGSSSPLISFRQDSFEPIATPAPRVTVVSYYLVGTTLGRASCAGATLASVAVVSDIAVARKVAAAPTVECLDAAGSLVASCYPLPLVVRLSGFVVDGTTQRLTGTRRNLWCMSTDPTPVPTTSCPLDP